MPKLPDTQDEPTALRAAIYRRVSTSEQATEGHSLESQEARCLALIEREGWQHVATYTDAGYSGADPDRPDLRRFLEDVAAGTLDVAVFAALDRLGRDAGHLRDHLRLLDAAGVRPVSVSGGALDRDSAEGRLQTGILSEFAEFERAKITQRATEGIRNFAKATGKPWGTPRYPFRKRADGHWEPDPQEVPVAKRMLRERAVNGKSYNGIAKELNREGVPTRLGGNWTATVVRRIVSGRHLLGEFEHGGEWYEGQHPAVVDEDLWKVAESMAERGSKFGPSKAGRRPTLHLFTGGMLRCQVCFEAMLPRSDGDCYVCRTNKMLRGAGSCPTPRVDRAEFEAKILAVFERDFLDLDATRREVAADLSAQLAEIEAQAKRAGGEASRLAAQRAKVERDYLDGELPAPTFGPLAERLDADAAAADAERDRLRDHADEVRRQIDTMDAEHDALTRVAGLREAVAAHVRTAAQDRDVAALRAAMSHCFEAVYVGLDGSVAGVTPADTPGNAWAAAIPFPKRQKNVSGSGVPEYPATTGVTLPTDARQRAESAR